VLPRKNAARAADTVAASADLIDDREYAAPPELVSSKPLRSGAVAMHYRRAR